MTTIDKEGSCHYLDHAKALHKHLLSLDATSKDAWAIGNLIHVAERAHLAQLDAPTGSRQAALDALNEADEFYQPETLEELRTHFPTIRNALSAPDHAEELALCFKKLIKTLSDGDPVTFEQYKDAVSKLSNYETKKGGA